MDDIAAAKAQLRKKILSYRGQRTDFAEVENSLSKQLLIQIERYRPERVATYLSFGSEPGTSSFIKELIARDIEVLVPRVTATQELQWFSFDGFSTASSDLGMPEPDAGVLPEVRLRISDVMVIPALAVDQLGNRLGRGKGYFDRELSKMMNRNIFAVCYESEFLASIPHEEHDQRVSAVVTEVAIHELN
jgi:5-formyltetrahydrofolate cyclo-ligase